MTPDDDNPAIHGSEGGNERGEADTGRSDAVDDEPRPTLEVADQGKSVVDSRGEDLGMVSDVDGDVLYVDPDPSLTEKVMSTLHWREGNRNEIEVPVERVERVDDEVVLDVDRDDEFRSNP